MVVVGEIRRGQRQQKPLKKKRKAATLSYTDTLGGRVSHTGVRERRLCFIFVFRTRLYVEPQHVSKLATQQQDNCD